MQNRKYLNIFKMHVDLWQYCTNNWSYFVIVPKHLLSKSFIHSIIKLIFLLIDSSSQWASHFFFFAKMSSFIKRGIEFQILGWIFVTKLCSPLWKPSTLVCSWHIVTRPLTDVPKFYRKCGFKALCPCLDQDEG